jgi:signal transduction histidine kinase
MVYNIIVILVALDIPLSEVTINGQVIVAYFTSLGLSLVVSDLFYRHFLVNIFVKPFVKMTSELSNGNFSERMNIHPFINKVKELRLFATNLNKVAEELNRVETLRTDFIANVSHEIKTPLSIMKNNLNLVLYQNLTEEEERENLKIINSTIDQLSLMVSNILKLNKLENQVIYSDKKRINITEQLRERIILYQEYWEKKQIVIDIDMEDYEIIQEEELLSMVWDNLLSNAIKFTENGGSITLKGEETSDSISVSMSDTGIGIPEEKIPSIFEKFYQGETSHSDEGNGLGLALVKRIIDVLNGEISVKSQLNKGTTFSIKIPKGKINISETHQK